MSEKGKNFFIAFIVIFIISVILAGGVYFAQKKIEGLDVKSKIEANIQKSKKNMEIAAILSKTSKKPVVKTTKTTAAVPIPKVKTLPTTVKREQKNGVYKEYYTSGSIKSETSYIDGKKDGEEIIYDTNGRIKEKREYKYGVRDGKWSKFYANGLLKEEVSYRENKPVGEHILKYENGNTKAVGIYVNGVLNGNYTTFAVNGDKKSEINFVNGRKEGVEKIYFGKNLQYEITYENGRKNGVYVKYYQDGNIEVKGNYIEDKKMVYGKE